MQEDGLHGLHHSQKHGLCGLHHTVRAVRGSHSTAFKLLQSLSALLKRVKTIHSHLKSTSNSRELSQTVPMYTQCYQRFSKLLLAASGHTKPSKRLSCQVGQSKSPTKDHKPQSAPTATPCANRLHRRPKVATRTLQHFSPSLNSPLQLLQLTVRPVPRQHFAGCVRAGLTEEIAWRGVCR